MDMCKSKWMEDKVNGQERKEAEERKKVKYNLIFLKVEQNKMRVYWIVNGQITDIPSNKNENAKNYMRQNEEECEYGVIRTE